MQRTRLTAAEWKLVLVLGLINFTHILDFIIIMPLGPAWMKRLDILPSQFGMIIGIYGFAAFLAGILAAPILDRFDRKSVLLLLYAVFIVSTAACGIAPNYALVLVSRAIAGASGGVLAGLILTILGDTFEYSRRGTAMGVVMSSFAIASILGVPIGLILADEFNPAAPFLVLAAFSIFVMIAAWRIIPTLRGHMEKEDRNQVTILELLAVPANQIAYLFSFVLVLGSFTVVPYIAMYAQMNLGMDQRSVKWVYIVGGVATLFSMNLMGRLSDRFGKLVIYQSMAFCSLLMVIVVTNFQSSSVPVIVAVCTLFMVATSGRVVPAQAMLTNVVSPQHRGAFMSVNTAIQSLANGIASFIGGYLLHKNEVTGHLEGYSNAGIVAVVCALMSMVLAVYLSKRSTAHLPVVAPIPELAEASAT
jgi:predicted MFS family arabinose efflux permease